MYFWEIFLFLNPVVVGNHKNNNNKRNYVGVQWMKEKEGDGEKGFRALLQLPAVSAHNIREERTQLSAPPLFFT